jgi:hypothetical protein
MARKPQESQQETQDQTQQDQPTEAQQAVDSDQEGVAEEGNAQVQEVVDQQTDQGFLGTETDQTPNQNYTVEGVTSGAPVPETQEDPVAARREAGNGL